MTVHNTDAPHSHAAPALKAPAPNLRRGTFLVVTQDAELARSLRQRLELQGDVVHLNSCRDAIAALTPGAPLLGVFMDLDGCDAPSDAIKGIRDADPLIPVLVLASRLTAELFNGLHVLRAEVVLKPFGESNVDSFVQRAQVQGWLSDQQLAASISAMAAEGQLTPRESDVMRHTLGHESRESVIRRLGISEKTLKALTRSVLRKCNTRSAEKLTKIVLRGALMQEMPRVDVDEEFASEAHTELAME